MDSKDFKMIQSSIKCSGFFIFFKTRIGYGGAVQKKKSQAEAIKRDLVTLQIARILKQQDLALEQEKLDIELSIEPEILQSDIKSEIQPLKVRAGIVEQRDSSTDRIEAIEAEIIEVEQEIRRKNNALALILIMILL